MNNHLMQKQSNTDAEHKRFAFIELMLIWEGSVTASNVSAQFELHEKLSAQIIKHYKNLYPKNIEFSTELNGYKCAANMRAQFTDGSLHDYVNIIAIESNITQLGMPSRNLRPKLIRPILMAIREQRRLKIEYASVNTPQFSSRVIQPHNLVFDGLRWHVRAYCENNQAYRDFVLSRLSDQQPSELLDAAHHYDLQDEDWQTQLKVEIMPDPRLDQNRARIIALDYDMELGEQGYSKVILVRAALLMYFLQRLNLNVYHHQAVAQQIILSPDCAEQLKAYLPS